MTEPTAYHLHEQVDLAQVRIRAHQIYFDGRVDGNGRVDHYLVMRQDECIYIIENGFVSLISVWYSPVAPFVQHCKRYYARPGVVYGAPDHSRGVPGVTNWDWETERGKPLSGGER
jgi:hypothetical protein